MVYALSTLINGLKSVVTKGVEPMALKGTEYRNIIVYKDLSIKTQF